MANLAAEQSGPSGQPLSNPPEIASKNGRLSATLTVEPAELAVAGQNVTFPALYDGLYTPPVLRVQPGDTIQLLLNNFAHLPTNVHYHGFNVTPQKGGDDIYISIDQGDSFQYDFPIPADHPQGLYWYHPHRDPLLNTQIAGGMAGGIIVGDVLAPFPSLQGIPERVMLLKDLKTRDGIAGRVPRPERPHEPDDQQPVQAAPGDAAGPARVLARRQSELEHLLPAQDGRADLLCHGEGRRPAEPSRGDENAPPATRQPARGARLWAAERHVPASGRGDQHGPGG
jgi:FtsP/CotA-like multicopper oxidase with cupredoxin domain